MTDRVPLTARPSTGRRAGIAALASATALAAGVSIALPSAQAAGTRSTIANSTPSWLSRAEALGPVTRKASSTVRVYLAPRGGTANLAGYATALSTPGTSVYRHFLTTAQYRARFAPTGATVGGVESWLRSAGMTVDAVASDNRYVAVHGSVAAADRAFGVSIRRYRHGGQDVQAPSGAVRVPDAVASSVLSVSGLDTTRAVPRPQLTSDAVPTGFRNGRPCSLYYGQIAAKYQADFTTKLPKFQGQTLPYAPCGYIGPQLRAAYEGRAASMQGGAGVTVAVVTPYMSPTLNADAERYAVAYGDGAYLRGQLTQVLPARFTHGFECGADLWPPEEMQAVEAVHAMAPDIIDALGRAVDQNHAQLIDDPVYDFESDLTNSGVIAGYESVFLQGTVQGISFTVGSGDYGDQLAASGIKGVGFPASSPYVTAVGGTSTGIDSAAHLSFQTGWGTEKSSLSPDGSTWTPVGFLYGGGGGQSALFNKPSYQAGITPGASRTVPDVAMDGDVSTGMLIGLTQQFPDGKRYGEWRGGGTELSTDLFAGMTALTVQNAGSALGLLNPLIYRDRTSAFHDVTAAPGYLGTVRSDYVNGVNPSDGNLYSVRTFDQDSTLTTHPGYDYTTGLGTPEPSWTTAARPN